MRLAPREHGEFARKRNRRAVNLVRSAPIELEVARTRGDVGARLLQRFPAVARLERSELLGVLENRAPDGTQMAAFVGGRECAPRAVESGARGVNGVLDVGGIAAGDRGKGLAVRRIDHRHGRGRSCRDPSIGDEVRGRRNHGYGRPPRIRCIHETSRNVIGVTSLPLICLPITSQAGTGARACSRRFAADRRCRCACPTGSPGGRAERSPRR